MKKNLDNYNKHKKTSTIELFKARKLLMSLPPDKALSYVLNYVCSRKLVRSLSEENFYYFLNTVGVDDAWSILSLASNKQWEYLIDVEVWNKDQLDFYSLTNIFYVMLSADSKRLAKWCYSKKLDLIKLYLYRNITLLIIDDDEDLDSIDDDYFTNDGIYYIKFVDYFDLKASEKVFFGKRNIILKNILSCFSDMDYLKYQGMLMEIINIIPTEVEEEELRLRNMRLAEKGFLPYYEAISIYQPLKLTKLKKINKKNIKNISKNYYDYPNSYSNFLIDILDGKNLFFRVLQRLSDDFVIQRLQFEFTSLCNLLISADNKQIDGTYDLKKIVDRASGYLSIGIELMLGTSYLWNYNLAVKILKNWAFSDIFRIACEKILELKNKVTNWRRNSWFKNRKLKLHFWEDNRMGVIGGLLLYNPVFFRGFESSPLYQEFCTYEQICITDEIVSQVIEIDKVLNFFKDIKFFGSYNDRSISIVNLLLTMWVWACDESNKNDNVSHFCPIPLNKFKLFYADLWEGKNGKKMVKKNKKDDFLFWIASVANIKVHKIPFCLKKFIDEIFYRIDDELSMVTIDELDPRYINLFFIEI